MGVDVTTYDRFPRNGKSARDAASRVGVSVRTAQRWTSEPRSVWLERAAQRRRKIHDLREKGLTMRQIAAELEISVGTVHYALTKQSPRH